MIEELGIIKHTLSVDDNLLRSLIRGYAPLYRCQLSRGRRNLICTAEPVLLEEQSPSGSAVPVEIGIELKQGFPCHTRFQVIVVRANVIVLEDWHSSAQSLL